MPENKLVVDLNTNRVVFGDLKAKLTKQEAELMHVLKDTYPRFASLDYITACLVGLGEGPESYRWIPVVVAHIRKKVTGMPLKIISGHGVGYRLEMA